MTPPRTSNNRGELARLAGQIRVLEVLLELVKIANDMVKRGEAGSVVQAIHVVVAGMDAERDKLVELAELVRTAAGQ